MSTDIRFLQKYGEVLNDNFNAVLKQNLLFQTQIAVLQEDVKQLEDINQLKDDIKKLIQENNDLKNDLANKTNTLKQNQNTDADKHRLQTAVNTQMREISELKDRIGTLENDILSNKEYIKQLEDALPNSKKKKFGIAILEEVKNLPIDESTSEQQIIVESTGGNF
jgi:chromosome segregation ATPase